MSELIDRRRLSENTGQDADLAAEVLEIFREQVSVWERMLDPKLDPSQWADAAHGLKGAALGVGATQLAEACKTAETRGRSVDSIPSQTEAALLLNDIRDVMLPTIDAAAKIGHEISVSGRFRAS